MKSATVARHVGNQLAFPESVVRKVLSGQRPPNISEEAAKEIESAANRILEAPPAEEHRHARRFRRFSIRVPVKLCFMDQKGKPVAWGRAETRDVSLLGALVGNVRFRRGGFPLRFHRLSVHLDKEFSVEARLRRVEMHDTVHFGVEFAALEWNARVRLQRMLIHATALDV